MKLVRIDHTRCGDYSGTTYLLAPDDWDDHRVDREAYGAQQDYLSTLAKHLAEDPAPKQPNPYALIQKNTPDTTTVGELRTAIAAQKAEIDAWYARRSERGQNFESFAQSRGFVALYDGDHASQVSLDWGHRHGEWLNYGNEAGGTTTIETVLRHWRANFDGDDDA